MASNIWRTALTLAAPVGSCAAAAGEVPPASGSVVVAEDDISDARWFGRSLDLEHAVEGGLLAAGEGFDRGEGHAQAEPRADRYRRREPETVEPVVDDERGPLHFEDLFEERRQERQGEEAVGDSGA